MQRNRPGLPAMFLLLALCVAFSCIVSPSAAYISLPWLSFDDLPDPAELHVEADLYARADSATDTSGSVVESKPVGEDSGLTWDAAVGKGGNLVKLLDTKDLSQYDVSQSNFTKWEALAQNGWGKLKEESPEAVTVNATDWRPAATKLGLSTDGQKNIQYDLGQFDNVTVGGTSYRSSGGLYSNVMNTDGAVFALQNWSPRARGAYRTPSLDGSPGHELVPLQTWADVTFLEWVDACKADEKCVKGLKVITKCHAQSNATTRVGGQALGGADSWGVWPGKSFSKGSDQFAALMATPSGRGVAWLLLTHREQLGWKSIKSARLWSDKDHDPKSNYYTFQLEDRTDTQRPRRRLVEKSQKRDGGFGVQTNLKRQSQSNVSRIVYGTSSAIVNYGDLYASDHSYSYDEAQRLGEYLVNLTQSPAEQSCIQQSQWQFSDLASNGWSASTTELNDRAALDTLRTMFSDAKLSIDDEAPEHTVWQHDTATTVNGTTHPATHAAYGALYSKHAIVLLEASSPVSELQPGGKSLLPPLKSLSDVLWLQWADWSNAKKSDIKDLRLFEVYRATNNYTTQIVGQIFGGQAPPAYPGKSFDTNSKELHALLASPHGQGVIWLLSQHKSDLGIRVVNRLQIWNDEQPCLLFEIAAFQTNVTQDTTDSQPPNGEKTVRKSLSPRADSWANAIAKGKQYFQMLECGTGTASPFTSYDDLKTWGWTVSWDQQAWTFSESMKTAVEYLGATHSAEETWGVGELHSTQVTVDGTAYPPTRANYHNDYAPEFIVSTNNVSPRGAAVEQEPPMNGPFPKLERQSDVMFLEYQRRMTALGKPMTGLKGIIRSGVINEETQSIAAKALGMSSYVEARLPRWPGRDFAAGSDEAAALVASPNGRAAVWLLGTHKAQLGHKTISKVRVYSDHSDLTILFVFEDVNDEFSDDDEDGGVSLHPPREKRGVIVSEESLLQKRTNQRFSRAPLGPATDSAWTEAVAKGKQFLDMLNRGSGPQSSWTNYDDLAKWGWKISSNIPAVLDNVAVDAINYLELSPLPQMTSTTWRHSEGSDNNGRHYNPTNAEFGNYYSSEFIVAMNNWGTAEGHYPGPPPSLRYMSDVLFLVYSNLMTRQNKPLDRLKGVMRHQIANAETKSLIWRAIKENWDDQVKWPGIDFQADSDEFAALLASPNGRGVAWLLLNHHQLGRKTIDSVRVWYDGTWMLLFVFKVVTDQPSDQTRSPDPGSTQAVTSITQRSTSPGIAARAFLDLTPQKYQELVNKGRNMVSALQSAEDCFPQSEFTEYGALAEWGWTRSEDYEWTPMRSVAAQRIFDLVGASWDTHVNRKVTNTHDKTTVKDGKTYNSTGARYSNHYNPLLIVAKSNAGPASEGKRARPRVTGGTDDPFPRLARLSDVLFLEFRRVMAENKQPMDELKAVWRDHIINQITKEVAIEVASDKDQLNGIPKWPGIDFAPGSDEFAALIASPNGVGIAYLLLQHREQMGQKTISSVKVFYDMGLEIIFLIDDIVTQPGRLLRERRSPVKSSVFGLEQHPTSLARYVRPRALDDSTYATFTEKGKALVSALQATETCFTQSEWTADDALATWGWYRSRKPNVGPVPLFTSTKQVYDFAGASTDDNMNHRAIDMHDDKKEIDGVTYYKTGAEFDNRYNPAMIVAENIHGVEYQGRTKNPPVTGDPNPFPKLKFWSDVTFLEFQKFMYDSGQPIDALKAVWHRAIINPNTRDLAAQLSAVDDWTDVPDWPGKDFKPGTDGFAALIGSDNGKGVVYLLLQHREQLGIRTIINARVWKDHTLHILYSVDDTCSANSGEATSPPKFFRRADESDSQKVNDARDAGRFLIMAQDSTEEILESCLGIPQSSFTEPQQLIDSGWTMTSHRTQALEEDFDAATFDSWLDMNLDLTANSNEIIEYHHLDKTTGSDGTVYYPSGAYYQNLFSEGGIAALDNASPWKTGRDMNPTVDGRARPFPLLKQWSDAVFLIYKDFCNSDPTKMKRMKGCLRHNVVNIRAREVLHEYMDKHGDLQNGKPKPWPGTEYKLDVDDGFNVALGVPNGKGVAYLLATHREALGWKEIYMIRIFSVDWASSYNILYYIRDHKDAPARRDRPHAPLTSDVNTTVTRDLAVPVSKLSVAQQKIKGAVAFPSDVTTRRWERAGECSVGTYETALQRGAMLQCKLYSDADSEPQSQWVNYKSLDYYGWVTADGTEFQLEPELAAVLQSLGLAAEPAANLQYSYDHSRPSEYEGHDYPATEGEYTNTFNIDGGAIIADMNIGPDYVIAGSGESGETVPLKQYSDVVFLAWQEAAGNRVNGLKYIFRHDIANEKTSAIVQQILQTRGVEREPWPGLKIPLPDKDALALMGTPNGRGPAWMLIQHKRQLGLKRFTDVTIFSVEGKLSLCFWISDLLAGNAAMDLPLDLQDQPSNGGTEGAGLKAERSVVVPHNITTTPSISGLGERLMRAINKRVGDMVKNYWTALRPF